MIDKDSAIYAGHLSSAELRRRLSAASGDFGLTIRELLPRLVIEDKNLGVFYPYPNYFEFEKVPLSCQFALAVDGSLVDSCEFSTVMAFLDAMTMQPDDEIFRVFCREAARHIAAMPVEEAFLGEASHFRRCLGVARRCWPDEYCKPVTDWKQLWKELVPRLKAFGEAEMVVA